MFTAIRSCSSSSSSSLFFTHRSLSLPLKKLILKPYYSLGSSVFSTKHFSQKSLFFFNPRSIAMASRPSAFDLLMARKKPQQKQQESSPKKRKTTTSQNPSPIAVGEPDSAEIKEAHMGKDAKNDDSSEIKGAQMGKSENDGGVAKKPRVVISPDESLVELKKKAASFDPKKAVYWGEGQRVPFMFVAKALDAISKESGRIVITEIVCNMLRTVIETTPDDLVAVVYLLTNRIAPAHEGLELGIGEASIIKALAEACGAKETHIKKQYKEFGDLGLVAKACRSSQSLMRKPEALTVAKVFNTFRLIAKESGKDSQEKKKNHIKALLVAATDCEPQYLIRLLQSKLRIRFAEQTLLAALGHAAVYADKQSSTPATIDSPLEEAAKIVKQVYSVIPVYDKIVPALLAGGVWDLPKTCSFSLGVPVGPMLANPIKGVSEILDKFRDMEFTCEYKYDGEHAQIHYMENGTVEIYSRSAERNTGKFPDVAAAISRFKRPSVTSFTLDCEIVAYDREKEKILPLQANC